MLFICARSVKGAIKQYYLQKSFLLPLLLINKAK